MVREIHAATTRKARDGDHEDAVSGPWAKTLNTMTAGLPSHVIGGAKQAAQARRLGGSLAGSALESVRRSAGIGGTGSSEAELVSNHLVPKSLKHREKIWETAVLTTTALQPPPIPHEALQSHPSVSEGLLTARSGAGGAWTSYMSDQGRIVYACRKSGETQWSHPLLDEIPLPEGWERKCDTRGRVYYEKNRNGLLASSDDHEAGMVRWIHPGLSDEHGARITDMVQIQAQVMALNPTRPVENLVDPNRHDFVAYHALEGSPKKSSAMPRLLFYS